LLPLLPPPPPPPWPLRLLNGMAPLLDEDDEKVCWAVRATLDSKAVKVPPSGERERYAAPGAW